MLTAAITLSQDTVCTQFTVTDATDYTDEPTVSMTSRLLTLYKSAFNVVMTIAPIVAQGGSTYTIAAMTALVCYIRTNLSERAKRQSEDPRYENNVIFTNDTHRITIERDSAANAVSMVDIESAQLCLSRAKKIIDNGKIPY